MVYCLFLTPLPLGKIRGQTKSFEKRTQMNAFIELFPLSEKIGQEIKSFAISLVSRLRLLPSTEQANSAVPSAPVCPFRRKKKTTYLSQL